MFIHEILWVMCGIIQIYGICVSYDRKVYTNIHMPFVYVYVYVCMYVCMYVCICVQTYIHIYIYNAIWLYGH